MNPSHDSSARAAHLSDEIIETQKARSDLLKWKLLLVAALGATGLGFMDKIPATPLVLALIPFTCIYADLLCTSLKFRLLVIGNYFSSFHQDTYESFVRRVRPVFDLEDWALHWSTAGISIIVILIGCWFSGMPVPLAVTAAAERPKALAGALRDPTSPTSSTAPGTVPAGTNTASPPDGMHAVDPSLDPTGIGDPRAPLPARSGTRATQGNVIAIAGLLGLIGAMLAQVKSRHRVNLLRRQRPPHEVVLHNPEMAGLLRPRYSAVELDVLRQFLISKGTFAFETLPNGLFPAASAGANYHYVWVRDNVHVAHAHYVSGYYQKCTLTMAGLRTFLESQRERFQRAIRNGRKPANAMDRPHIRFDGRAMQEVAEDWSHAQNDALGYFLWLYCKLARENLIDPGDLSFLTDFARFFEVIEFWQDADNGHWEETAKVNTSSIGTVLAGLRELKALLETLRPARRDEFITLIDSLAAKGQEALRQSLPKECIHPPALYRPYDAALLFLIFPLKVVEPDSEIADRILDDVKAHLQGDHGIRRYLGDSYWCGDYDLKYTPALRASDVSGDMSRRDALLRPGEEAQWCIFDPIVSAIHGQRFQIFKERGETERAARELALQIHHLNRSLGQLTRGESFVSRLSKCWRGRPIKPFTCPEAYFLRRHQYEPNDQTPLLWTQANLWLALHAMRQNASGQDSIWPAPADVRPASPPPPPVHDLGTTANVPANPKS